MPDSRRSPFREKLQSIDQKKKERETEERDKDREQQGTFRFTMFGLQLPLPPLLPFTTAA